MGSDEAQRIGGGHVNGKPESDPVIRERGSESEESSLSEVDFCDATKMSSVSPEIWSLTRDVLFDALYDSTRETDYSAVV